MNMTSRRRSGNFGTQKRPKEKVVFIYEEIFKGQSNPAKDNDQFWNEFFLLLPNVEALENELLKLNAENLGMFNCNAFYVSSSQKIS